MTEYEMTLPEAIEELRSYNFLCEPADVEKLRKAVGLGIEALEAYYALRQCSAIDVEDIKRLPSETEGDK